MTSTELVRHTAPSLPEKMEWVRAMASATLLPRQYQSNPGNLLFAIEYADALGVNRMAAITSIHVIEGKPSASADLIANLVRKAGHKLRVTGDDTYAVAQLIRADDPDFTFESRWDLDKARAASLLGKGVWKSYPGAMLRSRAITEVARMGASDALFGVIYSPEELGVEVDSDGEVVHQVTTAQPGAGADRAREVLGVAAATAPVATASATKPAGEADSITAAQTRKLGVLMREAGLTDRDAALAYVAKVIGRTVSSRNELSKDEASRVIDALERGGSTETAPAAEGSVGGSSAAAEPDGDVVDAVLVPEGNSSADEIWRQISATAEQMGWSPDQRDADFRDRMGMIPDEAAAAELQAYLELIAAEVPAA